MFTCLLEPSGRNQHKDERKHFLGSSALIHRVYKDKNLKNIFKKREMRRREGREDQCLLLVLELDRVSGSGDRLDIRDALRKRRRIVQRRFVCVHKA